MKRQRIIGVMGGGGENANSERDAYQLGAMIAINGWILLNGGRNAGVMAASARGAYENGGLTIGILPDDDTSHMAPYICIPICTGMGSGRNVINVLSSDVVVACPGGAGTVSEIALALKHGKRVICMGFDTGNLFAEYRDCGNLCHSTNPRETISMITSLLTDP